jgi:hypothetical protein
MNVINYNRLKAVGYASTWAEKRNPNYFDFSDFGGDCTNFISQCVYAGSNVMNYAKTFGWYYVNSYDRSPSWSGVDFFYNFIINNKSVGPFAAASDESNAEIGDIIQLAATGKEFTHSLIITQTKPEILIATHSFDSVNRPLSTYVYEKIRFIKILGVRNY